MSIEDNINKMIATAIDETSDKFDRRFSRQEKMIDDQREEIIALRKTNTSILESQSRWEKVVEELGGIRSALAEVFGLFGKTQSHIHSTVTKEESTPAISVQRKDPRQSVGDENNRLRQLDIPERDGGKFLLDSGASTHVCGNLHQFVTRQRLEYPKVIALAVADCKVDVTFKGTIKIPTPTGTIEVNDVYYCPGVDGVILSVGFSAEKMQH
ncbi:hypothetical protein PSHT_11673 [Puccinia striiformis]|uniref:Retrovirus-related Pol polyprotein from transposon TNT 1-94-like beta-barrel domain-containing protein n=1 Tax=Puccinia striiformis TaxID=27350 RepID=A0A2S4V1F7_9BASI|nr:hypothetical protein PSHT_11673 [Puccinia striiformis]